MIKICAYVQEQYAKQNYKNECLDHRQFAGLKVIIDTLVRAGYNVEYAGKFTVHLYDVVLVSLTSDCDWWPYISERLKWQNGNYKVIVGGAGVLHVTPFLRWFDAAVLGRGENIVLPLIKAYECGDLFECDSVIYAKQFDENKIYKIMQTDNAYPHKIQLYKNKTFEETNIGCNHRCLFCGYTWHRKQLNNGETFAYDVIGLGSTASKKEKAILDMKDQLHEIDFSHLRITAMDGFSERIRKAVGKPITREMLKDFFDAMLSYDGKPHQIKLYNICGYPTETIEDWYEYVDLLKQADKVSRHAKNQWSIILHNTPFRPMPATPLACAPASLKDYRGEIAHVLGKGLKGNLIYQGENLWSVESMGTDSLSTVMLSMLAHRGGIDDSENIAKLCSSHKFWTASSIIKIKTLEKYFDMDYLFGAFTPDTLPSKYLRTWCPVEKMWGKTPLEIEYNRGNKNGC